jgi:hypothetical protein
VELARPGYDLCVGQLRDRHGGELAQNGAGKISNHQMFATITIPDDFVVENIFIAPPERWDARDMVASNASGTAGRPRRSVVLLIPSVPA